MVTGLWRNVITLRPPLFDCTGGSFSIDQLFRREHVRYRCFTETLSLAALLLTLTPRP